MIAMYCETHATNNYTRDGNINLLEMFGIHNHDDVVACAFTSL